MIQFIYLFCTSFISLFVYINYFDKNKEKNFIHLTVYYFICVLMNFLLMSGVLYFGIGRIELESTLRFSIKYILLSSVVALHLPLGFDIIKKTGNYILNKYFGLYKKFLKFIKEQIIKICKKFLQIKLVNNIVKYLKKNINSIKKDFWFIALITILFLYFDVILRCYVYWDTRFYLPIMLTPNILTIAYGLLVGTILVLLPKKLTKVLYPIVYGCTVLLFIVNYMLIKIKSEAFTVYNLQVASEGLDFINFIVKEINLLFIIILLISIWIFIYTFRKIKSIKCKLGIFKKLGILVVVILGFFGIRVIGIGILEDDKSDGWKDLTYPKYYTHNFINSRKSLAVLGLYDYMVRDAANYINNSNKKIGTIEDIENTINDSNDKMIKNEMSGIFKDKNLIMIMMESVDNVFVNKEVTPTLTKMMNEGMNFTKRYSQLNYGGSTIATEYTTLTGLYYTYDNKYDVNTYNESIPSMFKKNNYVVASFHENKGIYYNRTQLHKSFGFEDSYFLMDMKVNNYEYFADKQFFDNDELYDLVVPKNSDKPFMSFITTIAAHGPYDNNGLCTGVGYSDDESCIKYLFKRTDDMLKSMLERLEEDGLLDDTVIVLYSDHPAYSYNYSQEELANTYENIDGSYGIKNLPFVIYNGEIDGKKYDDIMVNDVDFAPTLFNMFGIEYDAKYYVGTDVFDENRINISMFKDYSWYDGNVYSVNAPKDNYYKEMTSYVKGRIEFSNMLVSHDYYKNFE